MEVAEPSRLLRMFGYWSVNHLNIFGIPIKAVDDWADDECVTRARSDGSILMAFSPRRARVT